LRIRVWPGYPAPPGSPCVSPACIQGTIADKSVAWIPCSARLSLWLTSLHTGNSSRLKCGLDTLLSQALPLAHQPAHREQQQIKVWPGYLAQPDSPCVSPACIQGTIADKSVAWIPCSARLSLWLTSLHTGKSSRLKCGLDTLLSQAHPVDHSEG
jgi:hypothetical protein